MVEMAFKVNPGTTFYKNYFATKEEKRISLKLQSSSSTNISLMRSSRMF